MSSQYNEHLDILEYFADRFIPGRFLDIGAYDGLNLSNTRPLYEAGWKGVLVEPQADNFVALGKAYPVESGCEIVNAGICAGAYGGLQEFWECKEDLPSTFAGDRREHFTKSPYRRIWTPTITLADLEKCCGKDYDFINLDAEGYTHSILHGLYVNHYRPDMICIEMDPEHAIPEMHRTCTKMGLEGQKVVGGNLLAWRVK